MTILKITFKNRLAALIMVLLSVGVSQAQEIYETEGTPASVQLRTNGLYDLALCPNVGIEIQTDLGLAFQLDYIGAWWSNNAKHRFW